MDSKKFQAHNPVVFLILQSPTNKKTMRDRKSLKPSFYELMNLSEISETVLNPFRDSCKRCLNSYMIQFIIICTCKNAYCCSCVSEIIVPPILAHHVSKVTYVS